MENDMTFVAPEGVYSVTEEHKPSGHTINANPTTFPTKLSTVLVRFPGTKTSSAGFANLLGGGKDSKRDKEPPKSAKQEDNASVSSSDTDGSPDPAAPGNVAQSPAMDDQPTLFYRASSGAAGKKKTAARPKHNMRTTSSTFIARLHTAEGLTKALQSKQGDVQFIFYNSAKSFFWTEAGAKQKVCTCVSVINSFSPSAGTIRSHYILSVSNMS